MSRIAPNRATTIPAKRKAQPESDLYYRLSRSMTVDVPHSDHLLFDSLEELPPPPPSNKRRVNPDSLALRLGPEIVAELESFVQPGVIEMPSFAIRQEIQTRYNVDRRHIYDWFHSKGLRVTKEDKRATVESKTDAMRLHRRVRNRAIPPLQSGRAHSLLSKPQSTQPSSVVPAVPLPIPIKSVLPPQPWSSVPVNVVMSNLPSSVPARPPLGTSRLYRDPSINSVYPVHDDVVLDKAQRQTCYDTLSRILGPAEGIQESVGSYGTYMARQRDIFYEDLFGDLAAASDSIEVVSHAAGPAGGVALEDPALSDSYTETGCHIFQEDLLDLARVVLSAQNEGSRELDTGYLSSALDSTYESDISLELDDILASQTLQEELPAQRPFLETSMAMKSVSFAPVNRAVLNYSSLHYSVGKNSVVNQTSSSLAGALGDIPSISTNKDQGALRKSREWIRPRMGRPRAYSAGGGM